MAEIGRRFAALIERIPSEPVVNLRYVFQLDPNVLASLLLSGDQMIDEILLEGGQFDLWLYRDYISEAYRRGTMQEYYNLSQQSPGYRDYRQGVKELLLSDAYQRRLILVRARAFEEMKGLTASIKADLSRVLTEGMGRGLNPLDIAQNIKAQTGISKNRANRIARTEITTALRRARWDEADATDNDLGLTNRLLHISALSPTTRRTHALRHGHVFTRDEVREWYSMGANAINCKCSQIAILTDKDGNPLNPSVIEKALNQGKAFFGKQPTTNARACGCGAHHQ